MKRCSKYFTLIELLVAMGLLVLLVMLMLQLFSGAQRLWVVNEKRSTVYADGRVAMELMAELLDGIQFSYGEALNASNEYEAAPTQNYLFSINSSSTDATDGNPSSSIIFLTKTSRNLPKTDNDCRFISFRRGASSDAQLRGKLLMVVYADSNNADDFYALFPPYDSNRNAKLSTLRGYFSSLVTDFKNHSGNAQFAYCQVIAENVVSFNISAYNLTGSTTPTDSRTLTKVTTNLGDIDTPPYMLTIQMTVLDADSYEKWSNLPDTSESEQKRKSDFLIQHQRTFSRNVFIGNRWALDE